MTALQLRTIHPSGPTFIILVAGVIFLLFGIGPNYLLALLVCALLIVGVFLLWRPGEPQILLFLFSFQWLQVATSVFFANLRGVALAESIDSFPGVDRATTLASIGLLSLAIGIRIAAGPQQASYLMMIRNSIQRIPASRWLKIHLIVWCVSSLSLVFARLVPGLSQPLLALADMRWGTFLIFTIVTFARPRGPRGAWLILFSLEFLLSLGGFFSSFKSVFLYTLIALSMVGTRITPRQILSGVTVAILMLILGLYWTAIKPEYRAFVSGGRATQAVVVGYDEALEEIVELVAQVDSTQLAKAANDLAERFAEIDIFSAVVTYVPNVRDYEWGKLWLDAISRPLMPRLFFPDKAVIDETALTNYYTGLNLAGFGEGTQIGMGYIADSYIDFGEIGMMVPIFLFGCFIGWSYRWLVSHPAGIGLVGCGLASSTLIQFTSIGTSSAKLVGGVTVCLLVAFIILNFILPRYMARL
jgi:hypothetical protein